MILKGSVVTIYGSTGGVFRMQMTVNVNEHGTYAHVGFINNDCLIMCVRTVRTFDKYGFSCT